MVFAQAMSFVQASSRTSDQSIQQPLPFVDQPIEKAVPARARSVKRDGKRYLQDILWRESLLAVRVSLDCQTVIELIACLQEKLPQNSAVTRRRNTSIILGRFFPTNDVDQLPRRVFRAYDDEVLLAAVMRVLFLEAEPLVGELVAERLHGLPAGSMLPKDFFTRYTQEVLGKKDAHMSSRCRTAARVLGWTLAEKGGAYMAQQIPNETAALLIFHHRYAPTPRVIDLKFLFTEPTWKYLGFNHEDAVRQFMRKLERRGLLSRYATVDRLEQVTTKYPLTSLLERKVRV
ncbi:MAG: hypothetical protein ACRERE_31760 [Candidatus Entotheonellia bacterium]